MKTITELSLQHGATIFVETEAPRASDGVVRVSKADDIIDRTQVQLEAVLGIGISSGIGIGSG